MRRFVFDLFHVKIKEWGLFEFIKLDKFSKHFFREIFSGKVFFHWNLQIKRPVHPEEK